MSEMIEEAMNFTKDKMQKKRETEIMFWLNTNTANSYRILLNYEPSVKAWNICVDDEMGRRVAEITSQRWRFLQILQDEDVETETI